MEVEKYFEKQLKSAKEITEEDLLKLKGKSLYSNYKAGDTFLVFFCQETIENKLSDEEEFVNLSLKTITKRELDKLDNEYKFIKMTSELIPIFERKEIGGLNES